MVTTCFTGKKRDTDQCAAKCSVCKMNQMDETDLVESSRNNSLVKLNNFENGSHLIRE